MLVFSSADRTQSSVDNGSPSQTPAYRSRMGPAFIAKSGSRGNSQLRWRHGRIASASSQRQRVVPLIVATTPRMTTSRCNSRNDQRASGTPIVRGLSQARRMTSTTTLGGKAGCAPASRLFVQPRQALVEEPLPPFTDDLALQTEARGDDVVAETVGCQQDNLRANDVSIRRRIFGRPLLERRSFFASEPNGERTLSRHASWFAAVESVPSEAGRVQAEYVIVIAKQGT